LEKFRLALSPMRDRIRACQILERVRSIPPQIDCSVSHFEPLRTKDYELRTKDQRLRTKDDYRPAGCHAGVPSSH
jgi:hypothetical protein